MFNLQINLVEINVSIYIMEHRSILAHSFLHTHLNAMAFNTIAKEIFFAREWRRIYPLDMGLLHSRIHNGFRTIV